MEQLPKSRNYGIDLLRIVSMFMVVVLHTLGQGGVLASVQPGTFQYIAAWLLEAAAFCAVNCFGVMSGYVGVNSTFRCSKAALLWLQIVFYTLLITAFFSVRSPEFLGGASWINAIFPITRSQYWYLSAYMGTLLLSPLLNAAVQNMEKRSLAVFSVAALMAFSVLPRLHQTDPYNLNGGYSMIWLCLLYIIGAYIGKYGVFRSVKKSTALFVYILCVAFSALIKLIFESTDLKLLGVPIPDMVLLNYTSPFMVFAAIALLMFFSKTELKHKIPKKAISVLASASLGVYLIHVHPLIWQKYTYNFVLRFAGGGTLAMAVKTAVAAVAIYLACSAVDLVRIWLFKITGINRLCGALDKAVALKKHGARETK